MIGLDKAHALRILVHERKARTVRLHHRLVPGIDDGTGKTADNGHSQEMRIHQLSRRQAKGDIGYAENGVSVEFIPDAAQGLERCECAGTVRGNGHAQSVDDEIIMGDAIAIRGVVYFAGNGHAAVCRGRDAVLVEGKADENAAVFSNERHDCLDVLSLSIDRVDHGLAVIAAKGALEGDNVGGIDLKREPGDALKALHHRFHHGRLVDFGETDIDVQNICAGVLLIKSLLQNIGNILIAKGLFEAFFAGRVDTLTDENAARADLHGL